MGCPESQDILALKIPLYITQKCVFPEMPIALAAVIMSEEIIYLYIKSNLGVLTLVEIRVNLGMNCLLGMLHVIIVIVLLEWDLISRKLNVRHFF